MTIEIQEHVGAVLGVPGRFFNAHKATATTWSTQTWKSAARQVDGYRVPASMRVEIRFDDQCRNGHNSFAITADVTASTGRNRDLAGGCLHDEIAQVFPELAPLIRWHLCSADAPMHYVENTLYLADDRDHNGLRAGEARQLVNGRTKLPVWQLVAADAAGGQVPLYKLDGRVDAADKPGCPYVIGYEPVMTMGIGKSRELDAARRAANWPDATDAQLCLPRDDLRALLLARLPALQAAMRAAIEAAGFAWEPGSMA